MPTPDPIAARVREEVEEGELRRSRISEATIIISVISLTMFLLTSARGLLDGSGLGNGYAYQAEAFLHGRLDIDLEECDIALHEGKSYLPFPPLPAVLLVPFVVLFGRASINVTAIALVLTCLNVVIFVRMIRRLGVDHDTTLWLAMAFFLGTGYWIQAVHCNTWAYAHVVAVAFLLLTLHEVLGPGRGIIAGLFLGCAVLSRQMSVHASVFIATALWMERNRVSTRSRLSNVLGFGLVLCIFVAIYLGYNWARFGNPLDTGYSYICHAGHLSARFERFGLFHPAYVPFNFTYMFLQGPHFAFDGGLAPKGMDPFGTSLLFASPFVLFAIFAGWSRPLLCAAWGSISLALLHMLFYFNNGWVQVNNQRFSLDFLPVLILLVALSMKRISKQLLRVSVTYSVILNSVALVFLPVGLRWAVNLVKELAGLA